VTLLAEDGVRIATTATGLLREFNDAGVLAPPDVHVARRLGHLGREGDQTVLLAVALAVRALRAGSVCVDLHAVDRTVLGPDDDVVDRSDLPWPDPTPWLAACRASPLVGGEDDAGRPLRLVGGLLYLDRYFREEEQVRLDLAARSAAPPPVVDAVRLRAALDRLFGDVGADDRQRIACAVGASRWVGVVAGGPGTGKTTTVARLLAVLRDQDTALRIALAAPTGKAAARMQAAVARAVLPTQDRARVGSPTASTLHRLLGPRRGSMTRFQYDRHRRLPYDVVVVDETSMVSLTLTARLLEAVRPDARIVLVGDPDQLASVEAGAVLGDLVRAFGTPSAALGAALAGVGCTLAPDDDALRGVTRLDRNHRNNAAIAGLAAAIRAGDGDRAVALLREGAPDLLFVESTSLEDRAPAGLDELRAAVVDAARATIEAAGAERSEAALTALETHRVLCAHRRGPYGVTRWAHEIADWLGEAGLAGVAAGEWYAGRPLLVTANDYDLGLYNGDTGVVVDTARGPRAVFPRGDAPIVVAPVLLDQVQTVHAMTVHKAQGSQFAAVTVVLPPANSPLLTRELLYTAVTRAEVQVRVIGSADAVRAAVGRPISRASGFARRA